MNIKELELFLLDQHADFQIIRHDTSIFTLEDGRKYFDVTQAVPTLILQADNEMFACMVSAEHGKINFESLKSELNLIKLKLADKEKIRKKIGFEIGAIPLIGHRLPCIIDKKILKFDYVYGGSGDPLFTLKISPRDLVALNNVIYFFE